MRLSQKEFDALVERAYAAIPQEFKDKLLNVEILVRDEPGPEAEDSDDGEEDGEPADLLGLYVGPMRHEIQSGMLAGDSPDTLRAQVFLYKGPLEDSCDTKAELAKEISLTLRHELAHHFGFEDEDLERIWPEGA